MVERVGKGATISSASPEVLSSRMMPPMDRSFMGLYRPGGGWVTLHHFKMNKQRKTLTVFQLDDLELGLHDPGGVGEQLEQGLGLLLLGNFFLLLLFLFPVVYVHLLLVVLLLRVHVHLFFSILLLLGGQLLLLPGRDGENCGGDLLFVLREGESRSSKEELSIIT